MLDGSKVAATIIAVGLIIGGFLAGGIYESHTGIRGAVVYRVNRFTGTATACFLSGPCRQIPEAASASKVAVPSALGSRFVSSTVIPTPAPATAPDPVGEHPAARLLWLVFLLAVIAVISLLSPRTPLRRLFSRT